MIIDVDEKHANIHIFSSEQNNFLAQMFFLADVCSAKQGKRYYQ